MANPVSMSIFILQIPSLLLLYILLLYLFNVILRRFRLVQKFSGHKPPTYPIIGCLLSFYKNQGRLLDWYTELLAESATNTIVVHRLGARRTVVTANPGNVEYMLKTNFNNFPKGQPFTEILGTFLAMVFQRGRGALAHTAQVCQAFDKASEICAKRGAAPLFIVWKIKKWLGIGSERQLKSAVEEIHRYVSEIIISKKKMIEKGENRITTSAAMTWLFWLLSCHPEIEKEVVKETKVLMERRLDYDSLKEFNLLKACLCESMRLYPPIAWDSKHAIVNDLLPDNTPVRAGDRVTYFPYGMGRMEALWGEDCFKFKPDLQEVCPYKFPIFQAGPRVCLGKEMAFVQMKYVMASMLDRFKIKPVSSASPVFVPLLTAHMAGGLEVLSKRGLRRA
ncbi:cytochrome P450 family protein [Salix suchowensis]|nr:cytochrome P450 family protein [Salix suchowensis]